ncbi:MAG: hypothetical protein HRU12_13290 [Phaeodactylibacter sp.]|nr:hypothetical protein [Phaeodactylibacter sp.]
MRSTLFFFLLLAVSACSSGEHSDPKLEKAASLHKEGIQAEETLSPLLDELEQQMNQINIQGKELSDEEQSFIQSASRLQERFVQWKEERIEVPGHEHHHDHDHDHDHTHGKKMPEATPDHMLNIQRESLESILTIKKEVEALLR